MNEQNHSMSNAASQEKDSPNAPIPKLPEPLVETEAQIIARLKEENQALKDIAASQPTISAEDSRYMQDIDYLNQKKAGASSNKITVKDITDHKNISLWTPWGKRIGPMHPNNAVYTYHKFRRLGRVLFTKKPSEDSIQAYYKTPVYIEWKKKYDLDRVRKEKSRKGKGLEDIINAMVKITGQNRADIVSIIDKPNIKVQQ